VNGYDRHPDITHLSNDIHLVLVGLSSRVYFEWVSGKTNPADLPSRADFIVNPVTGLFVLDTSDFTDKDRAVMDQLDSVHVPIVLPEVHQLDNLSFWITFGKSFFHVFFRTGSLSFEKVGLDQTHLFPNLNLELGSVQVQVHFSKNPAWKDSKAMHTSISRICNCEHP
jgi:hypothetical protein